MHILYTSIDNKFYQLTMITIHTWLYQLQLIVEYIQQGDICTCSNTINNTYNYFIHVVT